MINIFIVFYHFFVLMIIDFKKSSDILSSYSKDISESKNMSNIFSDSSGAISPHALLAVLGLYVSRRPSKMIPT